MIIGAQKAGTTSLKNYLSEHPEVISHPQIEFSFFNDDAEYALGYSKIFNRYFSQNQLNPNCRIVAKNVGICTSELAIKRLQAHNPACQLVFILRNPVERAYSSYTMEVSNGWFKRDFAEVKSVIKNKVYDDVMYKILIELGLYARQLEMLYKYFPANQVKLYRFEDIKTNSSEICKDLFQLLQVNTDFAPNITKVHNKTRQVRSSVMAGITMKLRSNDSFLKKSFKKIFSPRIFTSISYSLLDFNKSDKVFSGLDKDLKAFLIQFYKPHNYKLQQMLGPEFDISDWNK